VFFVISGYLITQLLTHAPPSTPGAFLSSFYVRRDSVEPTQCPADSVSACDCSNSDSISPAST
jgi:hypothetical protein